MRGRVVEIDVPRVIVSGVRGKIGKTLITIAITMMLTRGIGLRVQVFKIGPDFIDPTYHTHVSRSPCRSIDLFMMGYEGVLRRFAEHSLGKDFVVIEGVFGLYDSVDGISEFGSTAQMAKILGAPVILVIDAERANRSIIPVLRGFRSFDPDVSIEGVVVTNVGGESHARKLVRALEREGVEVVGVIPRSSRVREIMRYRHLGLIPVVERTDVSSIVEVIERDVMPHIDVRKVLEIGRRSRPIKLVLEERIYDRADVRIGIVCDKVFSFVYPEVFEECHACASNVYYIDSLRDQSLPDVDVLVIAGGFPELYARELSRNRPLMSSIRRFVERGGIVYAECGGLMYLTSKIVTPEGEYDMCDVIEAKTVMSERPIGHGYVVAEVINDNPISRRGQVIRGHEFHHSMVLLKDESVRFAYRLQRGVGVTRGLDGILVSNVIAQYMHLHPEGYNYVRALVRYALLQRGS